VERGHLRAGGRRDRERGESVALDVDRGRWRAQARRRRLDRVAAVRQAPVPLGGAIVTPAGNLAARSVIHAVSLDRERRTSAPVIEAAVRSAMARAREIGAASIAFPALGTGVGGFPLDEAARITVETVRDELTRSPTIAHVVFALRGAAAYHAFSAVLHPAPQAIEGATA
jgi:O-acetyl-ADP-ribose deacetylase (regulator of RNase III)